jgi:catechol 2,3-dioxygenase-like lactoylglutathione lyase family enzyme
MTVRSLGWLGVRTPNATAMTAFYRDVLQLEVILDRPGATWFRLGDGAEVHVYGSDDADHEFFVSSPVAGFCVDSFDAARTALQAAGIEFIYAEPQRAEGRAWGDLVLLVVGQAGDVICGDVRVADSEPLRSVRRKDRPDSAGP